MSQRPDQVERGTVEPWRGAVGVSPRLQEKAGAVDVLEGDGRQEGRPAVVTQKVGVGAGGQEDPQDVAPLSVAGNV